MIPLEEIARLAGLYDRYNNALDPLSPDCASARRQFEDLARNLHVARAADLNYIEFRYELVRHCREYLRKNAPE